MKKLFKMQLISKIRTFLMSVGVLALSVTQLNAQYSFSALSGSFTPLIGGTTLSTPISDPIDLGFVFVYNGKSYTQIKATLNGFISFRTTINSNQLLGLSKDSLLIAPLADNFSGGGGVASYLTEGTAPNRIFTMEWLNFKWTSSVLQPGISFQVKLFESSNRIEFVYKQESGELKSAYARIGLSFHQVGKFMALTNSGTRPMVSSYNETSISKKPATGQIYRFDEVISSEPDSHVSNFSLVTPGSLSVKWTDGNGANRPARYLLKVSSVSFAAITNPIDGTEEEQDLNLNDGTGSVYVDYGKQQFAGWKDSIGNTTYFMKIFPVSNNFTYTNYKIGEPVPQIQTNTPFYQARQLSFSNIQSTSIALNWVRGSGSSCVVFAKENGIGVAPPLNNTSYAANSVYGTGSQIGSSGWYCVYNGTGNTFTVTGLKVMTKYAFHVLEYNGASGAEQYSTFEEPTAYAIKSSNLFAEQTGISLQSGSSGNTIAWGDYDNDGDLDILQVASNSAKIYKNNGNNTFAEQTGILPTGVSYGSLAWGDYDNDGDLDILVTGYSTSKVYRNNGNNTFTVLSYLFSQAIEGPSSWIDYDNDGDLDIFFIAASGFPVIYRNDGNSTFVAQSNNQFPVLSSSSISVAWGDYDNDGDLDVLFTAYSSPSYISKIYKNNGNSSFTEQTDISLPGCGYGSAAWGDYDNDGDLDILLNNGSSWTKIYRNNGNNSFTEQSNVAMPGNFGGSSIWGDYDNDGDLDILVIGNSSKIYRNNGDNTFSEQTDIVLPGVTSRSSVVWGDYDNDGDLDILLKSSNGSGYFSKVYRNDILNSNTIPASPVGLTSEIIGSDIVLRWNSVKTDATPAKGITYNVRVGSSSGASDVVSPMSADNGFRRLAAMGNAQTDTTFVLHNIKKGTLYWSVQAIDNTLAGGAFAPEQTCVYSVNCPAASLSFTGSTPSTISLGWRRGNGDKCIVFVKENGSGIASPINNVSYTANAVYGTGSQVGSSGWYCVYNGTGNNLTITGLKTFTNYAFHVLEYTGTLGSEQYLTVEEPSAYAVTYSNLFTPQGTLFSGISINSTAWGDYDNDGYLDILITGYTGSSIYVSKIYKNNGNNTFTEQTGISLIGVQGGSAAWGDYDNDGDLDILLIGNTSSGNVSKIYRNNGNNTFTEQTGISLTGVQYGSVAWGDYNNDGYLDILLTGDTGTTYVSKIYRNNGDNTFTEQTGISLIGVYSGSVAWGDYDNDGYLDILLTGMGTARFSRVYRNNGGNSFTEQTNIVLTDIYNSGVAWGDYDSDGDLDILMTGNLLSGNVTKIYQNNGNNSFVEKFTSGSSNSNRSAAWGDYDNDGDLDALVSGTIYANNGNNNFEEKILIPSSNGRWSWGDYDNDGDLDIFITGSKIWLNNISNANTAPEAPTRLGSVSGSQTLLHWKPVATDNTPVKGITYNVRVGTTAGASDIVSPMSNISGARRLVAMGNAQTDTTFVIQNLKKGTYYWSVQAIDNNFDGSAFASEQTFTNNDDYPATGLSFSAIHTTSIKCSWVRGNGNKCAVFAKENGNGKAIPVNNTAYSGNALYGAGSQIGSTGWYCVYNGVTDSVTVNGLKVYTNYTFHVIEYSGTSGAEQYITVNEPSAVAVQSTNLFVNMENIELTGLGGGPSTWGDYDNDGDLDIISAGSTNPVIISKLYNNKGDNYFEERTEVQLTGIYGGALNWGDYDNDGDLDVLMTGYTGSKPVSKIYRNNGNNVFVEQIGIELVGVQFGSASWGDYDNDGDLDILLTGTSLNSIPVSKIYRNNGNNTFTEQTSISIKGVSNSSAAWGDYDNDGDLDFLLTGLSGTERFSKIYRNNGDNTFTDQTSISLTGLAYGSAVWGDYDSDGDLDILLAGNTGLSIVSKIYRNNGNNTFTEQTGIGLTGVTNCSLAWGDYDNDGDLDILLTGYDGYRSVSKIYRNNSDNTFTEQKCLSLPGVNSGSVGWGDYDNDGDLDLLLTGNIGSKNISTIYRNAIFNANTAPSTIINLNTHLSGSDVKFTWDKPMDDKTPSNGLSYNLYVYETSKIGYFKAAEAMPSNHSSNGRRLVARIGNIQYSNSGFTLKGLTKGNYKWSIQAIDAGFKGSAFGTEGMFSIFDLSDAGVNVAASQITNTASGMNYSLNSTDGINGSWLSCSYPNTSAVSFGTGGFDVWVSYNGNKRKVATIAAQALAPAYTINYLAETTTENIPGTAEYSTNSSMEGAITGNGGALSVTPGTTTYLRIKATNTAVASAIQTLQAPSRPDAPTVPVVEDYANTFDWTFNPLFTSASNYEYSVSNGATWAGCTAKPFLVGNINLPSGSVKVRVKATASNFTGSALASNAEYTLGTGVVSLSEAGVLMYPNPVTSTLYFENLPEKSQVSLYTIDGKLVLQETFTKNKVELQVNNLRSGMYLLIVKNDKGEMQTKFSKQ